MRPPLVTERIDVSLPGSLGIEGALADTMGMSFWGWRYSFP